MPVMNKKSGPASQVVQDEAPPIVLKINKPFLRGSDLKTPLLLHPIKLYQVYP